MRNETFAGVWDAIEDNAVEAENIKLRASLMMALDRHIHRSAYRLHSPLSGQTFQSISVMEKEQPPTSFSSKCPLVELSTAAVTC